MPTIISHRQKIVKLCTLFLVLIGLLTSSFALALAAPPLRPANQATTGVTVKVTKAKINLRGGPGTNFAVVGTAAAGESYPVVGRNAASNWLKITLKDGKEAWVAVGIVQVSGDVSKLALADAATAPAATTATNAVPAANAAPAQPTAAGGLRPGELAGRLLYSKANDDAKRWELWEYNFGTGEDKKIADWRTEVDVSPDGKQIVYYAWPPAYGEEKSGIWIADANLGNDRLVVPGGAYPSFSPGGDRLVLNGGDTLYVITTDAKDGYALTKGEYPAWSSVSNEIVHRGCIGGSCGLWVIDANGKDGQKRQLTTGGGDGQPAWSPDGKRIAYISKEDGNFEIYVIGNDGSGQARLTTSPNSDGLPVWSPDGKWIAFRSDRGGGWAVYVMRVDGSDVRKVIDANVLKYWFFEKMAWRK